MAVLLQFNVSDSWTVTQLEENTQIKQDFLVQVRIFYVTTRLLLMIFPHAGYSNITQSETADLR